MTLEEQRLPDEVAATGSEASDEEPSEPGLARVGDAADAGGPRAEPGATGGTDEVLEEAAARDYLDDLRRLQADFDNYRKRMIREQTAITERATARLIERLLPVLDNFERAVAHGDAGNGVELAYRELQTTLRQEGLEEVLAQDEPFDPTVHEAVEVREDEGVTDAVCSAVYRLGYRLKGRLLRPAMVVVTRPPEGPSQHEAVSVAAATGSEGE